MNRPDLLTRLCNREYREAFISSTINSTIAYQIRGLRKQHDLDQRDLGALAGMKQTAISRLENPDYGNLSVNTLKRIAKALDVGLIVRFAPFSEIIRWRSLMSQRDMTPPTFSMDMALYEPLGESFGSYTHIAGSRIAGRTRIVDSHVTNSSTAQQLPLRCDEARMPAVIHFHEQSTTTQLARAMVA